MKDFSDLKKEALGDPEARRVYELKKKELQQAVRLAELREARRITQTQLAKSMKTTQSSISRLEKQTDLYLTTLRSYVEAMGGKLEISAVFPDGHVPIEAFGALKGSRRRIAKSNRKAKT